MAYPEAIAHFPEGFQIAIRIIHNRIESGKNALIPIVGQTGSGKSLLAIQFMRGLYMYRYGKAPSDDYILRHIVFKAKDFMEEMNNPHLKKKENWSWDEAGVDIGHKEHATIKNRILGWLTQTFRNLQQVVFFTVPSISFLDASVRKLLHYYIETLSVNKRKKMTIAKPLQMQYNIRMDKIYYHNLTSKNKKGEIMEVHMIGVPKISDELEERYEEVKNKFTIDLNLRIQSLLTKIEVKENKQIKMKPLTERQEKILELLKSGMSVQKEIAKKLKTNGVTISQNLQRMRNKGVDVDKYLRKRGLLLNNHN